MDYLKKLGKSLLITMLLIFFLSLLTTILYYFNIISSKPYNILKLIIPLISIFIGSFLFGKKATKKGALEGLKLGGIIVIIFLIIYSFILKNDFHFKLMIYDILLVFTSCVGGIIGINRKKEE